jgi:hypothetical protein
MANTVLREVAQELNLSLGPVVEEFNPRIQAIVSNWPVDIDGTRAIQLGLPQPPPLRDIILQYIADFRGSGELDSATG